MCHTAEDGNDVEGLPSTGSAVAILVRNACIRRAPFPSPWGCCASAVGSNGQFSKRHKNLSQAFPTHFIVRTANWQKPSQTAGLLTIVLFGMRTLTEWFTSRQGSPLKSSSACGLRAFRVTSFTLHRRAGRRRLGMAGRADSELAFQTLNHWDSSHWEISSAAYFLGCGKNWVAPEKCPRPTCPCMAPEVAMLHQVALCWGPAPWTGFWVLLHV